MVHDINPGRSARSPALYAGLDGVVVFAASTPDRGLELWRSDGTPDGTTPLGDLVPGAGTALTCAPVRDVVAAGRMYFLANDGRGCELWRSDGTAAGTQLVRELVPGAGDAGIDGLTAVGDLVVFAAATARRWREPWRSDGSSAGTIGLADLAPGAADSLPAGFPFVAAAVADTVVFAAKDGSGTSLLWRSDGTAGGTEAVTGFAAAGSRGSAPEGFDRDRRRRHLRGDQPGRAWGLAWRRRLAVGRARRAVGTQHAGRSARIRRARRPAALHHQRPAGPVVDRRRRAATAAARARRGRPSRLTGGDRRKRVLLRQPRRT